MRNFVIMSLFLVLIVSFPIYTQTWSAPQRLTWTSGKSSHPVIAVAACGFLHVAWYDSTSGNNEIYYKRSTDAGATWSAPKRLTWNSGSSYRVVITADSSSGVYLVWQDDYSGSEEIYFKKSTDSGVTWSKFKRMTWNTNSSLSPFITTDSNGYVHVAWHENPSANYEIFYKRSTDGGNTWDTRKRMTWNSGVSQSAVISADSGNNIHIVWSDDTKGNAEIFYKKSTDSGVTWSALKRLSWNAGWSGNPAVTTNSSNGVFVTWQDYSYGNDEILFKRSTNSGSNWSSIKRLTWNTENSMGPSITTDSSNIIHIVWFDGTSGSREIFHRKSTDSGVNWSSKTRLTWNSSSSSDPTIDAGGSAAHLVWSDYTPGNYEIYYKDYK